MKFRLLLAITCAIVTFHRANAQTYSLGLLQSQFATICLLLFGGCDYLQDRCVWPLVSRRTVSLGDDGLASQSLPTIERPRRLGHLGLAPGRALFAVRCSTHKTGC